MVDQTHSAKPHQRSVKSLGRAQSGFWNSRDASQDFTPLQCIIPSGERRINPQPRRCLYERIRAKQTVFLKQLFGSRSGFESIFQFAVDYGAAPLHRPIVGWKFSVEVTVALIAIMKMIVDKNLVVALVGLLSFQLWLGTPHTQGSNPPAACNPAYHQSLSASNEAMSPMVFQFEI
ncbi:hypothetical protein [Mesorhizobium sophorae]|uniref:hypothetical protein n=1 Tax=Mesorhizobium sophorae TaxID=1300294 RepID=UPI000BA38895|nr:hypothetical protein [Mesorhizobium sophorae]